MVNELGVNEHLCGLHPVSLVDVHAVSLAVVLSLRLLIVVTHLSLESSEATVGAKVSGLSLWHRLVLRQRDTLWHDSRHILWHLSGCRLGLHLVWHFHTAAHDFDLNVVATFRVCCF